MKALLCVGLLLTLTHAAGDALADDDRAVCFDAVEKGQSLREAHKLVEARDQFRLCAAATCPATMHADCSNWLSEVEKAIPKVVLSAKDAAGNDVFEVTVTVDDKPLVTKLEGTAIPVDPGAHTFRFQWPDGTSKERQVLVAEGQKDVVVAVSLVPPAGERPAGPSASPVSPPANVVPSAAPAAPPPPEHASTWRTIGWVAGGVGVAGLVVGAIFTGITISDKNDANCNAAKQCTNYASMNSAMSAAPVAGTGLVAGGALVVAGTALVLLAHPPQETRSGAHSARLRVAPALGAHGAGALLEGAW
jgi:hypothetical protein